MRIFCLSLILIFGAFISVSAHAVQVFDHCKDAEHTADILKCLNKRSDAAASRLNDIYEQTQNTQSDETREAFLAAQTEWIKYRDGQCGWAKTQAENESLQRIAELSCLITLAEQRHIALDQFSETKEIEKIDEELVSFPRWMNVVARENPAVYWRYGDHVSADLNCDGQSEEILLGQTIEAVTTKDGAAPSYAPHSVLAVVSNPAMGKPESVIIPVEMVSDEDALCVPQMSFVAPEKIDPASGEEVSAAQCGAGLEIKAKGCALQTLRWMGEEYAFDALPNADEK